MPCIGYAKSATDEGFFPRRQTPHPSAMLRIASTLSHKGRGKESNPMDARDFIKIGMSAERTLVVPAERTVGHFVPGMPMVYATPMMILEMEMASSDAIKPYLRPGWITVDTEVDIRHLGASLVGAVVRVTGKVTAVERRVIRFEVGAFEGERRIGDGRHARGLVNAETFTKRLGTK
jgi:fluoroacetyl-CoA thioesterase